MKKIYVDGVEVTKLVNRKDIYTWFLCIDDVVRRVSTYDWDKRERFMISA